MISVLVTVVVALGWWGWVLGWPRTDSELHPAERAGFAGLISLGVAGTLTFLIGLMSVTMAKGVVIAVGVLGIFQLYRHRALLEFKLRRRDAVWLGLLIIPLLAALTPSVMTDWDTLAYHLAVPKIWIQEGRFLPIPFIHHSHFPFSFDSLYVLNLSSTGVDGQYGAKLWTVVAATFGLLAIAGVVRRHGGSGYWASLAFAGIPVVLWETGSGYIDVVHGLWVGLGAVVLFAGIIKENRPYLLYALLLLGFGCASKYTALQGVLAAGIVGLALTVKHPKMRGLAAICCIGSIAFGGPWFARNVILTGNPVYPFLYERLGGRGWDQWRADIYRDEQQTFGVGRTESGRSASQLPHAVLGLGYQPGRYINPNQTEGGGFPMGAVGAVPLVAMLGLMSSRRRDPLTTAILSFVLISFVMWFFLSQQSRYMITLAVPLAVALGCWIPHLGTRGQQALKALCGMQAIYSFVLLWQLIASTQAMVAVGSIDRDQYLRTYLGGFVADSAKLNQIMGPDDKVALYDEVFGFLLDRKYIWANPGHSRLIKHEGAQSAAEYVSSLKENGISFVYVSLNHRPPDDPITGLLSGQASPPTTLSTDPNRRWRELIAQALAERQLELVEATRGSVTFRVGNAHN